MQLNVIKQQKDLEVEKIKVQEMIVSLEISTLALKRHTEDERTEANVARRRVEREQDEFNMERQQILNNFQLEKEEFAKAKEEFSFEKKRMFQLLAEVEISANPTGKKTS